MKSKFSKYLGIPSGSASGTNPASGQSNVQPQPQQPSGGQQSQQAVLNPPAPTRISRLWDRLRRSPSPSRAPSPAPSPSRASSPAPPPPPSPALSPGTQCRNSTTVYSPQSLVVLPSILMRPHSSCSGTTTMQKHNPGSPSPSGVQSSSSMPPNIPTVRILHPPTPTSAPLLGPNVAIGSSSHSSQVWATTLEIAEKKLSDNSLPPLDISTLTSQPGENIRVVVQKLTTLQEENIEKQWSYTRRGKEVRVMERLGKVLKIVDNYSKVVDIAIQSNPQVTALIWSSVRAIIQVALNHVEVIEGLEVALAALVEKVSICEFYAEMYYRVPLASQSIIKLDSALPEFYAAVVVFTAKARGYFEAGGTYVEHIKRSCLLNRN